MLKDIVGGLLGGVAPVLGGIIGIPESGGTGGGQDGGDNGSGIDVALNLGLPSLEILDLSANLLGDESLIAVDGTIFKRSSSGDLIDVGLDLGTGTSSNQPLINVNGQIFGRMSDGALIDLDLNVGLDGLITDVGDGLLNPVLPSLRLLDTSISLLDGESLLLVDGSILKRGADGSTVDLGLTVGSELSSGAPLVVIDGNILGIGLDGSFVDLDLDVGPGGVIDGGDGIGGGNADGTVDIFRFYNSETGAHFYTGSEAEKDSVIAEIPQFQFEGNTFDASADASTGDAVFRFYNSDTATHFYTTSVEERDNVIENLDSFSYEGVAYYGYEDDGGGEHQALYRFFNTETGTHFYTASDAERAEVVGTLPQYQYEGVAYYVDVA